MRKFLLLVVSLCVIFVPAYYFLFVMESPDFIKYKRVQVGMSVDDVQAILGPGTPAKQESLPGMVVAVNAADVEASGERHRKSGGPPQTVRDYPT